MSQWVTIATGLASGTVFTGGVLGFGRRLLASLLHRVAKDAVIEGTKELTQGLNELKLKFATETGGNSGGFRQKLDEVATDVAVLKGAFGQHVVESKQHATDSAERGAAAAAVAPPTA